MKMRRVGPLGRLRLLTAGVFLALALPAGVLVHQAWQDLRWEALHQQRVLAQELIARVNGRVRALIAAESARPATDYAFLNLAGDPQANFVQRSPLAAFPAPAGLPGLVGHFEVDARGRFATPLLPPGVDAARYGVPAAELAQRQALAARMADILARSRLVRAPAPATPEQEAKRGQPAREARPRKAHASAHISRDARRQDQAPSRAGPANAPQADSPAGAAPRAAVPMPSAPVGQAAFDALEAQQRERPAGAATSGRALAEKALARRAPAALARKERSALPALADAPASAPPHTSARAASARTGAPAAAPEASPQPPAAPVRIFESEVDPFVLGRLESGHFVLYRRVWRDGARAAQGLLIEPAALLAGVVESAYRESAIAATASVDVRWQGTPLARFDAGAGSAYSGAAPPVAGPAVLRTALAAPFDALTLGFTSTRLPPGPGAGVVAWTALVLALVLVGGLAALYRLGAREIALARDQRDFVTRVSHELRTPLTAIRMYGEMLVHGWADAARRPEYYAYIHDEAQRLSRLIENVLTFGRASRDDLHLALKPATAGALMDLLRSRLSAPVESAGFALHLDCPDAVADARVRVDADAFTQVLMNLVDNALKFAAQAPVRVVEVSAAATGTEVSFAVRDHGPGIARGDLKRVFRPFYRAPAGGHSAPGTGIGLALVRALTRAMGGRVQARNASPGVVFTVRLARVAPTG